MLIVKTPAHFRIKGKDIRTGAHSFIIFRPDTPPILLSCQYRIFRRLDALFPR
jgi:AraC family transcriptional regulator of arabinose operon